MIYCSTVVPAQLQNRDGVIHAAGPVGFKWARRLHRLARLPGMVGEVIVQNHHLLNTQGDVTPILAFTHKKIHDLFTIVEFMLARPFPMPQHTVVAQGGLFGGIYAYRDWVPRAMKRFPFRSISIAFSRAFGRYLENEFRAIDCHPVYRRFRDVPSRKVYESIVFAGPEICGLTYDEFTNFTRTETQKSIDAVKRQITQENRSLVIFPEGKYQHDGSVGRLNNFLMNMAIESGHPLLTVSQTYDELCPDSRGRIDAIMRVNRLESVASPGTRFVTNVADSMQTNSAITASNLIAIIMSGLNKKEISKESLVRNLEELVQKAKSKNHAMDERLLSSEFILDRVNRFLKANKKILNKTKTGFTLNESAARIFQKSERTVPNLQWNMNVIRHTLADLQG